MDAEIAVRATCHCGTVTLTVRRPPAEVTECNCSLCTKYGVIWWYVAAGEIVAVPDAELTHTYAWNDRHVDFHRCRNCGCVTHWIPRDPSRERRGINARLLPREILAAARVRHRDGANTGENID